MVLGPNVDIPRNPWWSRIGETFGEDPLLSGRMAAGFVRGAQASGDMAVNLKHYNVYTQETNRRRGANTQNSVVDERTIRELYTRPWAIGGRRGLGVGDVRVQPHQRRARVRERLHAGAGAAPRARLRRVHPDRLRRVLSAHRGLDRGRDGSGDRRDHHLRAGAAGRGAGRPGQRGAGRSSACSNILRVYFKYGVFDHPLPATQSAGAGRGARRDGARDRAGGDHAAQEPQRRAAVAAAARSRSRSR